MCYGASIIKHTRDILRDNNNHSTELKKLDQALNKSFFPYAYICNEWCIFGVKIHYFLVKREDSHSSFTKFIKNDK